MSKSLEEILINERLITKKNDYKIKNKKKALEIYKKYLNETGFINKWLLKGYKFLKNKKFNGFADDFLSVYLCGSMTQKDQEAFALILKD